MKNIKGALEGPIKDKLDVAVYGTIRSNTLWEVKNPTGDIFAAESSKEPEADTMNVFLETHMTR